MITSIEFLLNLEEGHIFHIAFCRYFSACKIVFHNNLD